MFILSSSVPRFLRLPAYFISEFLDTTKHICRKPRSRASYGRLLNLPRLGVIQPGAIYRSGEPRRAAHFQHIDYLGIKTILCVKRTAPHPNLQRYIDQTNINFHIIDIGQIKLKEDAVERAYQILKDRDNHPILVHCDGGRHRAGVLSACVRISQGWSLDAIIKEHLVFARPSPFWDHTEFIAIRMAKMKKRRIKNPKKCANCGSIT